MASRIMPDRMPPFKPLNRLNTSFLLFFPLAVLAFFPSKALSDAVVFNNGRILEIQKVQWGDSRVKLILLEGGELIVPKSHISRLLVDSETTHRLPAFQSDGTYARLIAQIAQKHNIDPMLIKALVRVESNSNTNAVSVDGAKGLMQLMPLLLRHYNVSNPFDPESNLEAGSKHLAFLIQKYESRLDLALAAYNAGEPAVNRYGGVPPFRETRNYVKRILTLYQNALANRQSPEENILNQPSL